MARRHKDADAIWNGGASNRRAVANALARAVIECYDENNPDCHDAGVQLILDHLCFLCGLPQPVPADQYDRLLTEVARRKEEVLS